MVISILQHHAKNPTLQNVTIPPSVTKSTGAAFFSVWLLAAERINFLNLLSLAP